MAVYLIPIPIAEGKLDTLSRDVYTIIPSLHHFFVENTRTARRFIKSIYPEAVIDTMQFSEIDKHNGADMKQLKEWLKQGKDIGVMSESGCPGIADPGAELVAMAQEMEVRIVPLVGPSSVLLALMASGFNGQSFCFNGYLPIKEPLRGKAVKDFEQYSQKNRQTQIFIETPYRNNVLLDDFLRHCNDNTRLCIAYNISGESAFIKTKTIKQWKLAKPVLEKQPCVFLLLA